MTASTSSAEGGDDKIGGGKCPFCGATGSVPSDYDSWFCQICGRDYPTRAFKCRHPGCWEFVFLDEFCDKHKSQAGER